MRRPTKQDSFTYETTDFPPSIYCVPFPQHEFQLIWGSIIISVSIPSRSRLALIKDGVPAQIVGHEV